MMLNKVSEIAVAIAIPMIPKVVLVRKIQLRTIVVIAKKSITIILKR